MKLLLCAYLASLKERGELDAILPDLVSELGHTVLWRPAIGTRQDGVDFASVGPDAKGVETLHLYVIKAGNLTRTDWNASEQGVLASLNEVRYAFLKSRVQPEHQHLPVKICICFGGEFREPVQGQVNGYIRENKTKKRSYEIWHGDKLAELLMTGVLRKDLLPRPLQAAFEKSVAMLDDPLVSIRYFNQLRHQLLEQAKASDKARVAAQRQLYIVVWILFVWGRDAGNLEAPCQASELAVLAGWELMRSHLDQVSKTRRALSEGVDQLIQLHVLITGTFIETKIFPHVCKRHGLSLAVASHEALDVNLRLFDLLGRVAIHGLWTVYALRMLPEGPQQAEMQGHVQAYVRKMFDLVEHNPALYLPVQDAHACEVALVLMLWRAANDDPDDGCAWMAEMVGRLSFTLKAHGLYTCCLTNYSELCAHPRDDEGYREEATAGSTLVPLLLAWCEAAGMDKAVEILADLAKGVLSHCNFQTWFPDEDSEDALYIGGKIHGVALTDLPIRRSGKPLLSLLADQADNVYDELSAVREGLWPLALMAFRAQRLPIPPKVWLGALEPEGGFPPYADLIIDGDQSSHETVDER